MLIRFAIEPDAFIDSASKYQNANSRRNNKVQHISLIRWWERHGVLIDPGNGENSVASIFSDDRLDASICDLWKQAWKQNREHRRAGCHDICWNSVASLSDFNIHNYEIDLALVESTRALELGIEEDTYSVMCDGVCVCELLHYNMSSQCRRIAELAEKPILRKERTEHTWEERLKNLARYSKQIIVVDPYAVVNIDGKNKGLFGLFNYLDRDASGCYVTIYSSIDSVDPSSLRVKYFDGLLKKEISRFNRKGIREVNVYLNPDFNNIYKERYIRFDHGVCEIGHWLEALGMPKTSIDYAFAYSGSRAKYTQVRETERRLRERAFQPFKYFTKN